MNHEFLRNAVHNLVKIYESGLVQLKIFEAQCNGPTDVEFITRNCEILQSNEK